MNDREFAAAKSAFQRQQGDMRAGLTPVCSPLANSYIDELERRAAGGEVEATPPGSDAFTDAWERASASTLAALRARPARRWWEFWR